MLQRAQVAGLCTVIAVRPGRSKTPRDSVQLAVEFRKIQVCLDR